MGQRVTIYDDMDESEDDVQPCDFTVAGVTFHIDLGPGNRRNLLEAALPFMKAARRHSGRVPDELRTMLGPALPPVAATQPNVALEPTPQTQGAGGRGGEYNKEVRRNHTREECLAAREWAAKNGVIVSEIGQIPLDVWEAYYADNPSMVRKSRLRLAQD